MMQYLASAVSGSVLNFLQNDVNASINEVDGVIGYHAPTVAPAYTAPSAAAVLPSMMMESLVASIFSRWNGSGQS